MKSEFTSITSVVLPIDRPNVDTDAIMPKQFMKSVQRTGFGPNLFDEWRYLDRGEPGMDCTLRPVNPDFPLNQTRYQGANILLARHNFGCGSSREHAAWALLDAGIRVLIAPSFADIFYGNCFKNGMLPIVLDERHVNDLFDAVARHEGFSLTINLEDQVILHPDGHALDFEIDSERKRRLLLGLDDISLTLGKEALIQAHETRRRQEEPWLFAT